MEALSERDTTATCDVSPSALAVGMLRGNKKKERHENFARTRGIAEAEGVEVEWLTAAVNDLFHLSTSITSTIYYIDGYNDYIVYRRPISFVDVYNVDYVIYRRL